MKEGRALRRFQPSDGEPSSRIPVWQRFRDIGNEINRNSIQVFQDPTSLCSRTTTRDCYCPSHNAGYNNSRDTTSAIGEQAFLPDNKKNDGLSMGGTGNNPFLEYMKLNALPEVAPFFGKENESFKRFVNGLI